ncbi:kinase-like domain-containing protein [Rhizophagus irregularis DAOM 181602=DAOM 197198]|nr:kinase-like domain-containing protein [Rhizophagus irregularis DAOM 181602=DAOM 197198]
MLDMLMKEDLNLSENLNEFLKEWEYHKECLGSDNIIDFYGFTKDPNTSKYMVVMDYANEDLKSLDIKADENTSENLSEVLESEGSQASVKVNEMLHKGTTSRKSAGLHKISVIFLNKPKPANIMMYTESNENSLHLTIPIMFIPFNNKDIDKS